MATSPEGRAEREARADRSVRRGELSEALALLDGLAAEFPDDAALAEKRDHLRANLQPMELQSAKVPRAEPVPRASTAPGTPEQEGERLFAIGDYGGAAAAYRRALKERPDSELIRERLEELFRLAQAAPRHSPTDQALPRDPTARLTALLDRIAARKRVVLR